MIPGSEGVRSPKRAIQDSFLEQTVRYSDQVWAPEHTLAEALDGKQNGGTDIKDIDLIDLEEL